MGQTCDPNDSQCVKRLRKSLDTWNFQQFVESEETPDSEPRRFTVNWANGKGFAVQIKASTGLSLAQGPLIGYSPLGTNLKRHSPIDQLEHCYQSVIFLILTDSKM